MDYDVAFRLEKMKAKRSDFTVTLRGFCFLVRGFKELTQKLFQIIVYPMFALSYTPSSFSLRKVSTLTSKFLIFNP